MRYVRVHTGQFAIEDSVGLRLLDRAPWLGAREVGIVPLDTPRLPPVTPSKIVCVGRNYRAHAKEHGVEVPKEPLLFLKPPSAVTTDIRLPRQSQRVEHEAELGVVIGADGGVFGLTCVNDVTARDLQKSDGQWTRAKGFDTFCPVGPAIVTGVSFAALDVACKVNGVTKQAGNTRDMVFPVPVLLEYIRSVMTLVPGDLVVTGTPEGVGPLAAGDVVEVSIAQVGVLRSRVA